MTVMPKKGREKSPEAIYHVMSRSPSEILLFRDEDDKDFYLGRLKFYMEKYKCSLYAYCLMDTHLHLHFDPKGFDISRFMACLNTSYAGYYNRKYNRRGSVIQDRFQSRLVDTDEYNFAVSAYIHNNPHDMEGYSGREQLYKYSSYGIYLGIRKDTHQLIDTSFMMGLFNIGNKSVFAKRYAEFVSHQRDIGTLGELRKKLSCEAENEYVSGRQVILREVSPAKVISFLSGKLMITGEGSLANKSRKKLLQYRAFTAYVLRVFSGLGYREICSNMYNITISGCSQLCNRGYELVSRNSLYSELIHELINCTT
jgi:putative transposase